MMPLSEIWNHGKTGRRTQVQDMGPRHNISAIYDVVNKFRQEGKYSDVTLQVQDKVFKSHRLSLAALSRYFDAMFDGSFKERNTGSDEAIVIHGIDADTFEDILEFMYTGLIKVEEANVCSLLEANDYLQLRVDIIMKQCVQYLRHRITKPQPIPHALEILQLALTCALEENLVQLMCEHIFQHLHHFLTSSTFMHLSYDTFYSILECRKFFAHYYDNEDGIILDTLIRWVNYNRKERKNYRQKLMSTMDPKTISGNCVLSMVSEYEFFKDNVLDDEDATLPSPDHKNSFLHVYVQCCGNGRERIFSTTRKPGDWSLSHEFISSAEYKRSTVLSNILYHLASEQDDFIFSARHSVFSPSITYLKEPPFVCVPFDICSMENHSNIYLYCDAKDKEFGKIFVYKSELDKWFSKSAPLQKLANTASVTIENGLLYLIGKECLLDSQVFDERSKKWSQLTNANLDSTKLYKYGECCAHNGKIYTSNIDFEGCVDIHVYDPTAGKWRKIPSLNRRKGGFEAGIRLLSYTNAKFENELWMISTGTNFNIEIFDANSESSHSLATLKYTVAKAESRFSLSYFLDAVVF